jgi:hypothetical protein
MRKAIIAICKWIIAKLEAQNLVTMDGKRRLNGKTMTNYPKHTIKRRYHKWCWVTTPHLNSYYPTQKKAADALSVMFGVQIARHDVYNALYHHDGKLYYGKKYLCEVSYNKE